MFSYLLQAPKCFRLQCFFRIHKNRAKINIGIQWIEMQWAILTWRKWRRRTRSLFVTRRNTRDKNCHGVLKNSMRQIYFARSEPCHKGKATHPIPCSDQGAKKEWAVKRAPVSCAMRDAEVDCGENAGDRKFKKMAANKVGWLLQKTDCYKRTVFDFHILFIKIAFQYVFKAVGNK